MLAAFRGELFEVCDALMCRPDRVHMAAERSLEPECRRGHGAVYKALNRGRVQVARLRWALAALPPPAWDDGRIRLAVDVSNWLRPDAAASPERLFCHCYGRGEGNAQLIPSWPYSAVAALEPGRTSWTLLLDAVRLGPADDATEVTAAQVREVVARLSTAGHWRDGHPDIVVIFDSGYDLTRLAWLLADLPVEVLGLRSDRVLYLPAPARGSGATGRPARHGAAVKLANKQSWPAPAVTTVTQTTRYGSCAASTLSTPSGSSNRPSAGPGPNCATRPPPTGGPGSCWPATPSSISPATSPPTSGCPGSGPCEPGRLTPARVRRGFRNIRQTLPCPAGAPKPGKPGPGRPPGSKNRRPATRHDVGKTAKRNQPARKPAGRKAK